MECDRQHFLSLWTPMDPENQNFEKMKTTLEDIIILQMFAINGSHMIYGFSDMECNRQNFWTVFCPNNPKNQNFEKLKKPLEISSFYKSVPKFMIICYTVP